jgi:hypothetical protein
MPEYEGSLPPVELSRTLWLAVLMPLVACILSRFGPQKLARRAYPLALFASFGLVGWDAARFLGDAPSSLCIVGRGVSLAQIGSLDLALRFELDAPRAVIVGALSALAAYGFATRGKKPGFRAGDAMCLAAAGGLCALLAANALVLALGWELGSLSSLRLYPASVSRRASRAPVEWLNRGALAALLLYMMVTFWGPSGSFDAAGSYLPDFRPRVSAVRLPDRRANAEGSTEAGSVTLLDWPSASVRLGGAELCALGPDGTRGGLSTMTRRCLVSAVSPFVRLPVPAGRYDVAISPSMGTDEIGIRALRFDPGEEIAFAPTAGTVDFRTLSSQRQIAGRDGARPFDFNDKQMAGFSLTTWMSVLASCSVGLRLAAVLGASRRSGSLASRFALSANVLGALCPIWHTRVVWALASAAPTTVAFIASFGGAYFAIRHFEAVRA